MSEQQDATGRRGALPAIHAAVTLLQPGGDGSGPSRIVVDEPPEPRRIRRPSDGLRAAGGFVAMVLLVLFGLVALGTTSGLESDLTRGGQLAPRILLSLVAGLTGVVMVTMTVGMAIERLIQRDRRRVADSVIAAAITYLISYGFNSLVLHNRRGFTHSLADALARPLNGHFSTPLHVYLATVAAFITIVGFGNHYNLAIFSWSCLVADAVANLVNGHATLIGLLLTFMLGRSVAYAWRYTRGVVNDRPTGSTVVHELGEAGLHPVACRWAGSVDGVRRYEVRTAEGDLDVTVHDRDQQTVGILYRIYRRIRLRAPAQRRNIVSLRRAIEQEALMAYAATAAGLPTQRLVAVRELSPDAAILAYEKIPGRTLDELDDEELTDELLLEIWNILADLQRHQLAHRLLAAESILVGEDGKVRLQQLRLGEIAAGELPLRLDIAELLTALGLRFGPERTVSAAAQVLGADTVASALPILQPVVLARTTRAAVRHSTDLLHRIREQILAFRPQAEAEPVRLERLRPRTLLSVIGGTVAAYLLLSQLTNVNVGKLVSSMKWEWTAAALLASALTYVAAAMSVAGFVAHKLPSARLLWAQLAASFVTLVAPAAVGGVAVNTRFLQRAGVPSALAVTTIGASQLVGFIMHILMLMFFSFITGTEHRGLSLPPSTVIIAVLLALAMVILVIVSVPTLRRFTVERLRPFFSGVLPRMLDVLQSPTKLATGLGGTILLSLANVTCLWACVEAFGTSNLSFANVGVVFLAGQAIGSAVPTPGGLGAVEAALAAGLTAAGMPSATAVSAVLVFRLLTFWLPVLPGWFAFTRMQKRGEL